MRWALLALLLAACIPAGAPPHLAHTPGAPIVVDGDGVITAAFRAPIPAGWRVILGEAAAPPAVTFVAPDDCGLIVVSALPPAAPVLPAGCPPAALVRAVVPLEGGAVALAARGAPAGTLAALMVGIG